MRTREFSLPFDDVMALAIVKGRKTQTRRLLSPKHVTVNRPSIDWDAAQAMQEWATSSLIGEYGRYWYDVLPRYRPGDVMWGREAHRVWVPDDMWACRYRADSALRRCLATWDEGDQYTAPEDHGLDVEPCKWRPAMNMPRWASRIVHTLIDVRFERLQNISEADAVAEGVSLRGVTRYEGEAREAFATLWDSINGKRVPWASNPWVVVYTWENSGV